MISSGRFHKCDWASEGEDELIVEVGRRTGDELEAAGRAVDLVVVVGATVGCVDP